MQARGNTLISVPDAGEVLAGSDTTIDCVAIETDITAHGPLVEGNKTHTGYIYNAYTRIIQGTSCEEECIYSREQHKAANADKPSVAITRYGLLPARKRWAEATVHTYEYSCLSR